MKKILLTTLLLNSFLISKVIEVDKINGKSIKTENDFIHLIKDTDTARNTIYFILDNIIPKDPENITQKDRSTEWYYMPGFAVFIPNTTCNTTNPIFIAMKHNKQKDQTNKNGRHKNNKNDRHNRKNNDTTFDKQALNCISSEQISFNTNAHTERQLCYAVLKYLKSNRKLNNTDLQDVKSTQLNPKSINQAGTIYIFCNDCPCFSGDKQTDISCIEYYSINKYTS